MQVKVLLDPTSETKGESVAPDLIASVTCRVPLAGLLKVTEEPKGEQGDVVLVRVQSVNREYSLLETCDGENVPLHEGALILGALGTRKALQGFSGGPPAELKAGMELYLLNRGGVIGECTAFHRDLGWPTKLEYLGTVSHHGQPANLKNFALPLVSDPKSSVPVVLVLGTCMNSGKTTVCTELVKLFSKKGFSINAGKIAGVGCLRDPIIMKESGAQHSLSFQDFGIPSTAQVKSVAPIARSMVHYLSESKPDFIVLEMGDGVLGGYQGASLFEDGEFMSSCVSMIMCANDLMGAWGGLQWLSQKGLRGYPILISGSVTDSAEGIRYVEENWALPAGNAFDGAGTICTFVLESLMPWLKLE
ncbi:MAG: hypothetical protein V3R94_00265 [Acidobacteriota bacterium]